MRKRLVLAGVVAALAVPVGACSTSSEYVVQGTEKSVGCDGVIEITRDQEDVNVVNVVVVNLPPPERHQKNLRAFVVWLTAKDGAPVRAGRLAYDPDARRGTLRVTTPNDQVFVQITAETSSRVDKPSEFVIMSKHVTLTGGGNQGSTVDDVAM
ncbi:MAG: hypothetical protein H6745_07380 [Deltaproteobacteria bacterium]|nr:hypothetical protein [Deltaproteobacteria bacterium]